MYLGKIVGYKYFNQKDENGVITEKVRVSFQDTENAAESGNLYLNFSFRKENVPVLTKDSLGKEVIFETGNYQGRVYGKKVIFK